MANLISLALTPEGKNVKNSFRSSTLNSKPETRSACVCNTSCRAGVRKVSITSQEQRGKGYRVPDLKVWGYPESPPSFQNLKTDLGVLKPHRESMGLPGRCRTFLRRCLATLEPTTLEPKPSQNPCRSLQRNVEDSLNYDSTCKDPIPD